MEFGLLFGIFLAILVYGARSLQHLQFIERKLDDIERNLRRP